MKHGKKTYNQRMTGRQITRKKAVKMADTEFSLFIRARDGYTCYCGKTKKAGAVMQCGHLISRSNYSTRWDEMNAACSCSGCNFLHESHPEKFTQWWLNKNGMSAYESLIRKSHTTLKISTGELQTLSKYFSQRTEEINKEATR